MKTTLDFLKQFNENNTREWFTDNRKSYEAAKAEFEQLLNDVIAAIRNFDPEIGMISAKECVFRIFRDVRFSKNKDPYKTNMGGFISKGGVKEYMPVITSILNRGSLYGEVSICHKRMY
ncbi:MAG: DUF2461 domain-containing protein [Bacteroidales bacterium]